MQGRGHQAVGIELGRQFGNYAVDRATLGVLPRLVAAGGRDRGNDGIYDQDGGMGVQNDARLRLGIEVEITTNAPVGLAHRVVELFDRFEMVRVVVALKLYPRRTSELWDGQFAAVCWVYRKDDCNIIHVERCFEMGTAPGQLHLTSKEGGRGVWDAAGVVLDSGVDDGAGGFSVEPYPNGALPPLEMPRPLPFILQDPALQQHFRVTVREADLFFGSDPQVSRPDGVAEADLVLHLYRALQSVDDIPGGKFQG